MAPHPVVLISQEERIARFGVLCCGPRRGSAEGDWEQDDGIVFRGGEWEPGGEYVQKLTVKNVTTKMKKLKYRLPSTRYFSLAFPETIELSPGMSMEIDVVFRPIQMETYDDTIYFKLEELSVGSQSDVPLRGFHVPVRALLSTLQASCPAGLDMGLCPTAETSERTFAIKNTGEVPAPYEWTVPAPFFLNPTEGILAVGEAQAITVSLHPTQASVFVARASCAVGRGVNAIKPQPVLEMKLSAIGKFVHITLSEDRLDFGEVLAGSPVSEEVTREVIVSNNSVVPATVEILRVEGDCEPVFSIHPRQILVPPQGEMPVHVVFNARAAGTYTAEHLEFVTPGGNRPRILLTGSATSPVVRVFKKEDPFAQGFGVPNSVNFGSVSVGRTQTRALFIENTSESPLAYQFVMDDGGSFTLSKYQGILPAKLEVPVKLLFQPDKPINYYRRLFLLVEHRMPLFVDLLGTAFVPARGEVKEQRPAPLRHAHLQASRNRVAAGLGQASPDELEELFRELRDRGPTPEERLLFARVGARGHDDVLLKTSTAAPMTRSGESTRGDIAVAHDLYFEHEGADPDKEVQISHDSLDFGCQTVGSSADRKRTVTVTNTTRAKITVVWRAPPVQGENGRPDFSVAPESADIPDGRSADFRVSYHPQRENAYALNSLEAIVFFKSQRSFRLVNDAVLAPPWYLQVTAMGHSFSGEQFAPQLIFEPHVCTFPGCHVGDRGYQNLKLLNRSNLPAMFRVAPDLVKAFTIKPAQGLIPAGGFQLLVARFEPREARSYRHLLRLEVNGEETSGPMLLGSGHVPAARVLGMDAVTNPENGAGHVTFQPTCVGLVSRRSFQIHNTTRVPLVFDVALPHRSAATFSIKPRTGVLRGNESTTVTVTFAPNTRGIAKTKCVVAVRPLAGAPPPSRCDSRQLGNALPMQILQKIVCRLVAPGACGVIAFEPPVLDYPTLLVNTTESKELVLANASDCAIRYSMDYCSRLRARAQGEEPDATAGGVRLLLPVPSEGRTERLLVDEPDGVLPARSRKRVKVTFQPDAAGDFEFACVCRVHAIDATGQHISMDPAEAALLTLGEEGRDTALVRGADPFAPGLVEELREDAGSVADDEPVAKKPDAAAETGPAPPPDVAGAVAAKAPADSVVETAEAIAEKAAADAALAKKKAARKKRKKRKAGQNVLPLTCVVRGRASFPTVVMRDIRVEGMRLGCSTPNMWAHFSLASLNAALLTPLTRDEVSFNLESSPDLSRLTRFPLRFVPEPLGSPPQIVLVDVKNPGLLPTTFSIHLPNERDIELEPWADEGEPTEADVRVNRVIDELKCFDVSPRKATLAPGEAVTLRFAYVFNSREFDGEHTLPILLRVAQGKQLWLDLQGRTLAPNEPLLVVPSDPITGHLDIHPVAVGTKPEQAPLQQLDVVNVGGVALDYEVVFGQPRPVRNGEDLAEPTVATAPSEATSVGCDLMRIENPKGAVPAGGTVSLKLRFLPIQACRYTVPVSMRYRSDCELPGAETRSLEMTLVTRGYNPRRGDEDPHGAAAMAAPDDRHQRAPHCQIVESPAQAAVLSCEKLVFGRLPQRTHVHRLVTLRAPAALSHGRAAGLEGPIYDFQWEAAHDLVAAGVVDIEPLSGCIEPGAVVVCRVILRADCEPRVVDASVLVLIRERPPAAASRRERRGATPLAGGSVDRNDTSASPSKASTAHRSLVTRCTISRERSLTQTTLPHSRLPMMPTSGTAVAPPPLGAQQAPTEGSADRATASRGYGEQIGRAHV